jgi:hypothetical protein
MARKPLIPPRDLFHQLRNDLQTEADSIATQGYLSARQELDRYLRHVKKFAASWLTRLARRKSFDRGAIYAVIDEIQAAVTDTASLSAVTVPPGVVPLGLAADGNIAPIEYPDRPAEMKPARHLAEFPPAAWEDQRQEALQWGDRDPARWGKESRPGDDPRLMSERLAEWERQVAECVRQDAPRRKVAEEIYRPHGVFEQAMPPNTILDRVCFRSEREYIDRTLRHHLMSCAERLLLDEAPVASERRQIQVPAKTFRRSVRGAPIKLGRPLKHKRSKAQIRRSREVHAECDPARQLLGWSPHDWANATKGQVSNSTIDRIMNGQSRRMQPSTRGALFDAMKEELKKHNRLDLLMTSPRWMGEL